MTCGNCGHKRWSHVDGLACRHASCDCLGFQTQAATHKHCYQDVHNCAWLTQAEHDAPRKAAR